MKICPMCGHDKFTELVYEQTEKSGVVIKDNGNINYDSAGDTNFTDSYILDNPNYPQVFICEGCRTEYQLGSDGSLILCFQPHGDILSNVNDISQVTFLTDRWGNPLQSVLQGIPFNSKKRFPTKEELDWYASMDPQEHGFFVEIDDGRRGILYLEEFSVPESNDSGERQYCIENSIDDSETVLRKIISLAEKLKEAGFNPFIGENTAPFDRHKLGGFIEAFTPPNNHTVTWLAVLTKSNPGSR